jgi:hypothetical protein
MDILHSLWHAYELGYCLDVEVVFNDALVGTSETKRGPSKGIEVISMEYI